MIDIAALLAERNPSLAERLPPGVVPLVQLVARERRINAILRRWEGTAPRGTSMEETLQFCRFVLDGLEITRRVAGLHHLEGARRPVVCANHPTGGIEGLVLMETLLERCGACRVPANDLLNQVGPLRPVVVPVRRGSPSREGAGAFKRAFAGDDPVLVFPAGVTARVRGGRLREYPWERAFVTHARGARRDILPVWVSGANSRHFYLIHRVRRALGISFNLEMVLLVDELFRRRGDTVEVEFLKPQYPAGPHRHNDARQVRHIQRAVERVARHRRNT